MLDPETVSSAVSAWLRELFGYNPGTRGLNRGDWLEARFSSFSAVRLPSELEDHLLAVMGSCVSTMSTEILQALRVRIIFLLMPAECLYGTPPEDRPIIKRHLQSLGIEPSDELVLAVKFFCVNFRQAKGGATRKWGIQDAYVKQPHIYRRIYEDQNKRCAVCGDPIFYGRNMQLDHIIPAYLGDDPTDGSNWQLLCEPCNRGKNVFLVYAVSKAGLGWLEPSAVDALSEPLRYAALIRDRVCSVTGVGPTEAKLFAVRRVSTGCWVLDNLKTVCESQLQALTVIGR